MMDGMEKGAPPQGGQQGGPEQVMAVFDNIMQAMNQVSEVIQAAPQEIQAKFQAAQAAYKEFLDAFAGGGQGASQKMAPEQAGNPDVVPAR